MTKKSKRITLQRFISETGECPDEAIYKDRHGECVVRIDGISETPFHLVDFPPRARNQVHYVRVRASRLFVDVLK